MKYIDLESWCYRNDRKDLIEEWDIDKNENSPSFYAPKSCKKVWWKHWHSEAKQWHYWEATIANRTHNNSSCPYCTKGRPKLLKGFNDLKTWCEKNNRISILDEWDYERNTLNPDECFSTSHTKVWWKCNLGHSWDMTIAHRTSMGCGCPVCANLRIVKGDNDLLTWCHNNHFEHLINEWDYDKNDCTPSEVVRQSHKKVYWKCELQHSWSAVIKDRVTRGDGCPECSKRRRTSFPEQAIYFYIKKIYPEAINGDRSVLNGLELDIFIPTIKVAIEYDGQAYHKDIARDIDKTQKCLDNNIFLYRIREIGCANLDNNINAQVFSVIPGDYDSLSKVIKQVLAQIRKKHGSIVAGDVNIDIDRDYISIQNAYFHKDIENSFAYHHPELLEEWDYQHNGNISPEKLSKTSHVKYYWLCPKGHETYLSSPANRHLGSGCPICANVQVLKGYNDFETWCNNNNRLKLLEEWDYELNPFLPNTFLPKSNKRVWWKCKCCGHNWQTKLEDRTTRERGCPVCAVKKRAHKKSKQVRNDDTGEIFENAKSAYQKYRGNITACCLGKSKTAAGYHWSYIDEELYD